MKYQDNFYDPRNGAESPIDTITAPEGYTAEQYIKACEDNADQEWIDMLYAGEVSLEILSKMKIFYVGLQKLNASEYQMGPELMEADFGNEWEGDTAAYVCHNISEDYVEGFPEGVTIYENFFGLNPKYIVTVTMLDEETGIVEPKEIFFSAYVDEEDE